MAAGCSYTLHRPVRGYCTLARCIMQITRQETRSESFLRMIRWKNLKLVSREVVYTKYPLSLFRILAFFFQNEVDLADGHNPRFDNLLAQMNLFSNLSYQISRMSLLSYKNLRITSISAVYIKQNWTCCWHICDTSELQGAYNLLAIITRHIPSYI